MTTTLKRLCTMLLMAIGIMLAGGIYNATLSTRSADATGLRLAQPAGGSVITGSTSVLTPLLDTPSAGTLTIANNTATGIAINKSGNTMTVAGNETMSGGVLSVTGAVGSAAPLQVTGAVQTSGANGIMSVTGAASTGQTASTEINLVNYALNQTVSWATGAITTERAFLIQAPTLAFAGASTVTNAATVDITNAPQAGSNATLTNAYALRVEAGAVDMADASVSQATNVNTGVTINGASGVITTQSASTAANAAETGFTVTNNAVTAGSVVIARVVAYSGTYHTNGQPDCDVTAVAAGSFNIRIINRDGTNALSGTMKIHFVVL